MPLLDYEEEDDDDDEPRIISGDMSTPAEQMHTTSQNPTPRLKAKPVVAAGPFHHRLATPRDVDTHAKVAEALRKVDGPIKNHESDSDEEEEEEEEDSEEEEEEMEEEEEERTDPELAKRLRAGGEDGDDGDDGEEEVSLRWKSDLATKARDAFYTRQSGTANLRKLVYGQQQVDTDIYCIPFLIVSFLNITVHA